MSRSDWIRKAEDRVRWRGQSPTPSNGLTISLRSISCELYELQDVPTYRRQLALQ